MTADLAAALELCQPLVHDEAAVAWALSPTALRDTALWYAAQGWPVFPCKPGEKMPATRNGFKDATTDPDVIGAWWAATPDANIGLPTGLAFDVVDLDDPDGYDSWQLIRESVVSVPLLAIAYTGGGGRHFYVPPTGRGNYAGIKPGIDYRGAGGYVLAPPSRLADGGLYSWITPPKVTP